MSRRRRRALKNYVTDREKASLIRNKIKKSLERVIISLGRLRLGGLRHQALLCKYRKVHHLYLPLPT